MGEQRQTQQALSAHLSRSTSPLFSTNTKGVLYFVFTYLLADLVVNKRTNPSGAELFKLRFYSLQLNGFFVCCCLYLRKTFYTEDKNSLTYGVSCWRLAGLMEPVTLIFVELPGYKNVLGSDP